MSIEVPLLWLLTSSEVSGGPDAATGGSSFSGVSVSSHIVFFVLYLRFKKQDKMFVCVYRLLVI